MNNTNIENLKILQNPAFHVDPTFYTEQPDEDIPLTPEEEAQLENDFDTEKVDRILEYLETQLDNPDAWVSWDEVKRRLRRYD